MDKTIRGEMNVENTDGIGISKKFAKGTVHENASGTFQILERYLDTEKGIMLRYEWLSGKNVGKVQENKENNVNASIHKYQTSLRLKGQGETSSEVVSLSDLQDTVLDIQDDVKMIIGSLQSQINELQKSLIDKNDTIHKLIAEVMRRDDRLEMLTDKLIGITDGDRENHFTKKQK